MLAFRFKQNPAFAICGIDTLPEPNIIALGAVATGNIKAQLAARAIGAINNKGSIYAAVAMPPKTGNKVAVVAVLLVSSVRNTTIATMDSIRTKT